MRDGHQVKQSLNTPTRAAPPVTSSIATSTHSSPPAISVNNKVAQPISPPKDYNGDARPIDLPNEQREYHANTLIALPGGQYDIAVPGWDSIFLINLTSRKTIKLPNGYTSILALLPNNYLATIANVQSKHSVRILDLNSGKCIQTINDIHANHNDQLIGLPNNRLAVKMIDCIKIFDVTTGQYIHTIERDDRYLTVMRAEVLPDGRLITASTTKIQIWDTSTYQSLHSFTFTRILGLL